MTIKVGMWIDHREAILVKLSDSGQELLHIPSNAESQLRRSSDHTTGPFEPIQNPADDVRERKKSAELTQYYDLVNSHLANARAVMIFGPGEAKKEFRKRIDSKHLAAGDILVESADRMTEPQIVAKVRQHFLTQHDNC